MMKSLLISIPFLVLAHAANFQVNVGQGGLVYNPNTVTANVGDTVTFVFDGTHSLAEAAFSSPCNYLSGGAWSGISPQPDFVLTVTSTDPRFFYCTIVDHCQAGMVFALNPDSSETFSAFQSAAEGTSSSETPPGSAVGGSIGAVSSSSSTTSSSTSSVAPSTSSSSTTSSSTPTTTSSSVSTSSSATPSTSSTTAVSSSATPTASATTSSSPTTKPSSSSAAATTAATFTSDGTSVSWQKPGMLIALGLLAAGCLAFNLY